MNESEKNTKYRHSIKLSSFIKISNKTDKFLVRLINNNPNFD